MKSSKLREEMFTLCREWEASGKNREDFCRERGINLARFAYWRTQYLAREKTASDDFVAVTPGIAWEMEIQYPNGVKLKVPKNIPISELKTLICLI